MVRVLLEGSKTQTRRLASSPLAKAQPDDLLYVREHWSTHPAFDGIAPRDLPRGSMIYTRADDQWYNNGDWIGAPYGKHRQGMHMPRWASRITLELHSVAFENLRDISEDDAGAEGMPEPYLGDGDPPFEEQAIWVSRKMQFRNLWNRLHDKPGERWVDDPTVVALTFSAHLHNVDNLPAGVLR